jgi:hypothetical protein
MNEELTNEERARKTREEFKKHRELCDETMKLVEEISLKAKCYWCKKDKEEYCINVDQCRSDIFMCSKCLIRVASELDRKTTVLNLDNLKKEEKEDGK